MGWSFNPSSGRDPLSYYPGDSYIDIVGSDGYNWFPGRDGSDWVPFATIFDRHERVRYRAQQAVDGR